VRGPYDRVTCLGKQRCQLDASPATLIEESAVGQGDHNAIGTHVRVKYGD
jgi:hypothetical protein